MHAHITAQLSAERIRERVNCISAAGMALVSQLETADELRSQLAAMEHASAGDAVISAAVSMIKTIQDQRAASHPAPGDPSGIPSLHQLQKRCVVAAQSLDTGECNRLPVVIKVSARARCCLARDPHSERAAVPGRLLARHSVVGISPAV